MGKGQVHQLPQLQAGQGHGQEDGQEHIAHGVDLLGGILHLHAVHHVADHYGHQHGADVAGEGQAGQGGEPGAHLGYRCPQPAEGP